MRDDKKLWMLYFILMALLMSSSLAGAQVVPTEPEGPTTLDIINSTRRTPAGAASVEALAGNVTQLSISANTVTQTWQAYYGNVTGTITLDDAGNNTIYNWQVVSPEGEIYASEAAIDFTHDNIACYDYNYSQVGDSSYNILSEYEALLGLDADDADGIDETFKESLVYDSFYVGSRHIDNTSTVCPATQMYGQDEQQQEGRFQELLLYDNSSDKLVYTAIIEQDTIGFDNQAWDFEMIVGENGHAGDTTTTTYYFYVEIE